MNAPRLRAITNADLPVVSALDAELFGPSKWSRAMFASELRAPWRHYVVAVRAALDTAPTPAAAAPDAVCSAAVGDGPGAADSADAPAIPAGPILGYAGIALGETAQVMTIGVNPAAQRQGIGRMLFADLLREAEEFGSREVILEVRVDRPAPQAMYRDFGFTGIGIRKNYYQAEGVDALVMKKVLGPRIGPVGSEVTT